MPFFYRIFFTVYFSFLLLLFMTGAGRYTAALGNETLHGCTLLESSVHMFYESKMILYRKANISGIKRFFSR